MLRPWSKDETVEKRRNPTVLKVPQRKAVLWRDKAPRQRNRVGVLHGNATPATAKGVRGNTLQRGNSKRQSVEENQEKKVHRKYVCQHTQHLLHIAQSNASAYRGRSRRIWGSDVWLLLLDNSNKCWNSLKSAVNFSSSLFAAVQSFTQC